MFVYGVFLNYFRNDFLKEKMLQEAKYIITSPYKVQDTRKRGKKRITERVPIMYQLAQFLTDVYHSLHHQRPIQKACRKQLYKTRGSIGLFPCARICIRETDGRKQTQWISQPSQHNQTPIAPPRRHDWLFGVLSISVILMHPSHVAPLPHLLQQNVSCAPTPRCFIVCVATPRLRDKPSNKRRLPSLPGSGRSWTSPFSVKRLHCVQECHD